MTLGPHADFIIVAYGVAVVVVGALIAWVLLDHRAQKLVLADLEARGVSRRPGEGKQVVNVWASWCVPCRDEAPLLMQLAEDRRIRIIGINYKDQPENARRFLGRFGNPFSAAGADENGRASIEWGVYGVPE